MIMDRGAGGRLTAGLRSHWVMNNRPTLSESYLITAHPPEELGRMLAYPAVMAGAGGPCHRAARLSVSAGTAGAAPPGLAGPRRSSSTRRQGLSSWGKGRPGPVHP